jgi:hypothetical protein
MGLHVLGRSLAMLPRLMGKWILTFIVAFWRMISKDLSSYSWRSIKISSFSRIIILSIRASKQYLDSKTTKSMSGTGQLNLQISIPLSIFGFISKEGSQHIKIPLVGLMTCGSAQKRSGGPLIFLWFRIW